MALTKITSRILDSSGVTTLGTISTGVWQGTAINQTYLVGQSGTNTGDETLARINALDITELGTVSSGVWNGTAIASAYLDADTAHLSTTQTFTGAKTFSSNTTFSGTVTVNGTGDSTFNGDLYIVGKKLDISAPSGGNAYVKFSDTNSSAKNWRVGTSLSARGVFNIYNETDDLLAFNILANGNVGIGTTSPFNNVQIKQTGDSGNNYVEGTLQVGGGSAVLGAALSYSALGSGRLNLSSLNNSGGANALISLGFGAITSGAPANTVMTLNQTGDVTLNGNGTTSALLFGQSSYARIINTSGQTLYVDSDVHEFRTNAGGAKLTISSGGNATFAGKLDITTSVSGFASTITNNKDDSQGLLVRTSDNDGGEYILDLQSSSSATGTNYASKFNVAKGGNATLVGTLNIGNGSASTPGLNFAGNGDAGFYNVGGDNIGFAANGAAVYSMNTDGITLESGKGLFVGGTGSANKLDDYEEGTWTPSYTTSGVASTVAYNIQTGYYTKVGNQVTCWGTLQTNATTWNGTYVQLDGQPFSASPVTTPVGFIAYTVGFSGEYPSGIYYATATRNYLTYRDISDDQTQELRASDMNTGNGVNTIIFSFTYQTS